MSAQWYVAARAFSCSSAATMSAAVSADKSVGRGARPVSPQRFRRRLRVRGNRASHRTMLRSILSRRAGRDDDPCFGEVRSAAAPPLPPLPPFPPEEGGGEDRGAPLGEPRTTSAYPDPDPARGGANEGGATEEEEECRPREPRPTSALPDPDPARSGATEGVATEGVEGFGVTPRDAPTSAHAAGGSSDRREEGSRTSRGAANPDPHMIAERRRCAWAGE